jgi:hypothetical protein
VDLVDLVERGDERLRGVGRALTAPCPHCVDVGKTLF